MSREAQAQLRKRCVLRVEAGESPEEVMAALGLHRSNIYRWLAAYREGGLEALEERKAPGKAPKLNGSQLQKLYQILVGTNPLQLKFEFALWTRAMVRELIRKEFSVRLSEVSVGRLLRKLGFSPQKPIYKAYQQDEEKRTNWKEEIFPTIQKLAKKENALIFFGDESSVRSDHHHGTTWAPVGETPVVPKTGARFSLNMISAIAPSGELRFMTHEGTMTADRFIEFLKRLMHNQTRKVFLILDGHPIHRCGKVRQFVDTTQGQLRIFILPPYSPDLNPDEWVWNWLKNHKLGRSIIVGPKQMRAMILRYLRSLQNRPHLVRGFFRDPHLDYIFA